VSARQSKSPFAGVAFADKAMERLADSYIQRIHAAAFAAASPGAHKVALAQLPLPSNEKYRADHELVVKRVDLALHPVKYLAVLNKAAETAEAMAHRWTGIPEVVRAVLASKLT
jgi:hypothetical protein